MERGYDAPCAGCGTPVHWPGCRTAYVATPLGLTTIKVCSLDCRETAVERLDGKVVKPPKTRGSKLK
jgi:hypothetical protein